MTQVGLGSRNLSPVPARFEGSFFIRPVLTVARELLGCRLVSTVGGARTVAVVVETEAYGGPDDPASHAATVTGITARNRVMYGPPGRAYVYRIYGIHWCLNVVTGPAGRAEAVLLRGVEPVEGDAEMLRRRSGRRPIGAGPGRLCQALGVTGALDGHDLSRGPLVLERGGAIEEGLVGVSARIGVGKAADYPWRFFVRGSAGVSGGSTATVGGNRAGPSSKPSGSGS